MILQMKIITALTLVNIGLLIGIISINVKSYMKVKAQYTIFFLIFAGLFLLQNLVSGYFFMDNIHYYVEEVSNHILILTALQSVAFSSLLWMEWR